MSVEKGRCASLRIQFQGHRQVILVSGVSLRAFMSTEGISGISVESVQSFFKAMSKEVLDKFIGAGNKVYQVTVGPKEGLLIPFDWVMAESTSKAADTLGVRFCFYLKTDVDAMEECSKWLISTRKPNVSLQSAIDVFVTNGVLPKTD